MKFPRFSIMQLMLLMVIFCALGTAIRYISQGGSANSPLMFLIILLASPIVLTVILSVVRGSSKPGK